MELYSLTLVVKKNKGGMTVSLKLHQNIFSDNTKKITKDHRHIKALVTIFFIRRAMKDHKLHILSCRPEWQYIPWHKYMVLLSFVLFWNHISALVDLCGLFTYIQGC